MLDEAALFELAEQMLVEVLGRIGDADLAIELPPIAGVTGDTAATLGDVVDRHLRDDATVPARLAGGDRDVGDPDVGDPEVDAHDAAPGDGSAAGRQQQVVRLAAAAVAAAGTAPDDAATRALLLRLTVVRSLVAHYVAAYLGSTACPLPEELAKPLWERTGADAQRWRETGLFRTPLEIPPLASWRDVFLRTAGHEPHPLGH